MKQVLFAPEVEEDLYQLVKILVEKEYFGTYEYAVSYVEDMVSYIKESIGTYPHKNAPLYIHRYGENAKYITYNKSSNTTWYILFEERDEAFLVTYITNNHINGQYFNV